MPAALSREELEAAACWEPGDVVPGKPAMTELRRRLRLHQARWREAHGHPMGTQPVVPRPGRPVRDVGSRLPLDYARETGAQFVTPAALDAATARTATKEPHQTFDVQRLWADLLWHTPLACNLFGGVTDRAVHAWWPDAPGRVVDVRFDHSPGRLDPSFTGNLITLDAALELDDGVIGVVTRYHDRVKREVPKPQRLRRYTEVAERSGAFAPGVVDAILGSDLLMLWLQHLLVLSMVQHPSGAWPWGRFVVVHLAANTDYVDACERYRSLLTDESTFGVLTIEDLLGTGALPRGTVKALRDRYLP